MINLFQRFCPSVNTQNECVQSHKTHKPITIHLQCGVCFGCQKLYLQVEKLNGFSRENVKVCKVKTEHRC